MDPRQRGLFGAAWILGYVAAFARGGAAVVTLGSDGLQVRSDRDRMKITVVAPGVTRFEVRGSGDLDIRRYEHPSLGLDISGSGDVEAEGKAETITVGASGSGYADLAALKAKDVTIDVSGSGGGAVFATGKAKIDMALRMLREAQIDARRLLDATEAALAEDGEALLSPVERQHIRDALNLVADRLETEADTDAVKSACNALNQVTTAFAARRMDASIRRALSGRTLDAIA